MALSCRKTQAQWLAARLGRGSPFHSLGIPIDGDFQLALDLKTARALARRFLASTVVAILVLGGAIVPIWSGYQSLAKEKDQLASDRKALLEERVLSENMRSEAAIALITQKADLDKREFMLQQLDGQSKERLTSVQNQMAENDAAARAMQKTQVALSQSQRLKEIEDQLQTLISQFSAMGVDLDDDKVRCAGPEGLAKFNTAKSKYVEIYTVAEAYGLTKRFEHFFFKNGPHVVSFGCDKNG